MYIYQEINLDDFNDAFRKKERLENFSSKAREALFDYLTEEALETEIPIQLDVILLCCKYREYDINDTLRDYNLTSLDELIDATYVIWHDDKTVLFEKF